VTLLDRARTWLLRALTAELALLVVTGVYLHSRYLPTHQYQWDTRGPDAHAQFVDRMRDVHRLSSWLLLLTAVVTLVVFLWPPASRRRDPATGAVLVVLALAGTATGYALPWDALALWAVTVGTDYRGYTWLFDDDSVRWVLVDGREIALPTLRRWYAIHVAVAAAALLVLLPRILRRPDEPAAARAGATGEAQPSP
jgi:quinol-cytochrome oxidoreductase complex cytochrome b subunit